MPPETLAALARQREIVGRMLATITDDVLAAWVRSWDAIQAELLRIDPSLSAGDRLRRLEQAKTLAGQRILDAAAQTNTTLTTNARVMIERGMLEQPELIATQLPPSVNAGFARPPGAEVDAMVKRTTEQITARSYALSVEATDAMNRALVLGQSAGDNPRAAAARMVRDAEAAFNGGLARAQVIARTEMIDAHRNAAKAAQDANADVLEGWVWVAELGPRTCASCIIQHGELHPLDEPGPLDHHQGRCARVPRTKTWEELGFTDIPEAVPPIESGRDWFNRQPENVQREVLGPKRFEAWQAGDYPPEAWSVRKPTDGWRDAYHVGNLNPPGSTSPTAAPPVGPKPLSDMDDTELEAQMLKAMEGGDYAFAEAAGEELDGRFYSGDGTRIDTLSPHTPTVYDWYEKQDSATQQRYFDRLTPHNQMTFHEAQWAHTTGRVRWQKLPTLRQQRKEYADWLDQEWVRAEAVTNGNMLSRRARAKGAEVTDLWKVNAATARSWASEELLDYWDTNGRMTVSDWLATYTGGKETTATLNAGRWLQ